MASLMSAEVYDSKTTISDLNDDCFYQVFALLTLKEKCGVERVRKRWRGVIRDMLVNEDRLELIYHNEPRHPVEHYNAYFSENLTSFFRTAVLNDEVVALFLRFTSEACDNKLKIVVKGMKHLTINQTSVFDNRNTFSGRMLPKLRTPKLKAATFEKLMSIFPKVTSLEFVGNDLEEFDEWAWPFLARNLSQLASLEALDCSKVGQQCGKLVELLTNARELKVLKTVSVRPEQIRHLKLEVLRCRETENLSEILNGQTSLKEVFIDQVRSFSVWLPSLAQMSDLTKVVVKFGYGVEAVNCGLRPNLGDFPEVQSLVLVDVKLFVSEIKIIVDIFKSLSKFEILGFLLEFTSENETKSALYGKGFDDDMKSFLETIATLEKLKGLVLEYRLPYSEEGNSKFSSLLLPSILNNQKLPLLRRFACNLFNIDDCFQQFCVLAKRNPKQRYLFKEFENYYPPMKLSKDIHEPLPRNIHFF